MRRQSQRALAYPSAVPGAARCPVSARAMEPAGGSRVLWLQQCEPVRDRSLVCGRKELPHFMEAPCGE
jgi:hypothetical protein